MTGQIEAFDWSATQLGSRETWPTSLRVMVSIAVRSSFPMLVFWGEDLVQIYNDAFVPILGARHPAALGQRARECWPEIWEQIGQLLHSAFAGESVWRADMPLVVERNGFPEQTYFTFSYSPFGESHEEGGVLCTCVETTRSVMRELEFRAMADNVATALYMQGPQGNIEWANLRWFESTNLSEVEANTLEGWSHVIAPDDYPLFRQKVARAVAYREPYEAELRIKPFGSPAEAYRWHLFRAVPMVAADGHVFRWAGSATDIHDRRVAQDARRTKLERAFVREHRFSVAFQEAALPKTLPDVPGMSFDAIYESPEEGALVGGDWYDAFQLSDGRVVVSVGDVAGSGLDAAVTMAGARQAIRGAAQVYPEPAAVLDAADRALRSEQPNRIVTAFLGIIDPLTREFSYASAGHPAPVLRTAAGEIVHLSGHDLPLGLRNESGDGETFSETLREGGLLVLYTDGLTEATRNVFEGEARLQAALNDPAVAQAQRPAEAIRRAVVAEPNDDIAVLTVRIDALPDRVVRWSLLLHDEAGLMLLRREFASVLATSGATPCEIDDAQLVLGELLGNVVRHTDGEVEVALDLMSASPVLHVLDRGPGFTFHARLPSETMSEGGRGLYIAMKLAREISVVRRIDGGSHARVVLAAIRRAS